MSTETLLWLESTGSACLSVRYSDDDGVQLPGHTCAQLLASSGNTVLLLTVSSNPREGKEKGEERGVHMRALSLCSLELYVRDTVFQASIYRSIHMAIHFCSELSSVLPGLPMHFLKHLSVILCSSS